MCWNWHQLWDLCQLQLQKASLFWLILQNVIIYKMTKLFEVHALRRVGEIEPRNGLKVRNFLTYVNLNTKITFRKTDLRIRFTHIGTWNENLLTDLRIRFTNNDVKRKSLNWFTYSFYEYRRVKRKSMNWFTHSFYAYWCVKRKSVNCFTYSLYAFVLRIRLMQTEAWNENPYRFTYSFDAYWRLKRKSVLLFVACQSCREMAEHNSGS